MATWDLTDVAASNQIKALHIQNASNNWQGDVNANSNELYNLGTLHLVEETTPGTPSSGHVRLYIDSSDHGLRLKRSDGSITRLDTVLPDQTGDSGKYLTTNGSAASWADVTKVSGVTFNTTTATNAHLLVADGTDWESVAVSGDATLANTGALTLATVNGNVGTFGSTTLSPQITVDAKGRITAVVNQTIAGGGGGGTTIPVHLQSRSAARGATSITFRSNVVSGSIILVLVGWESGTGGSSLTDNLSTPTTYTKVEELLTGTNRIAIFVGTTVVSGACTITPTWPSGASFKGLYASEYDGVTTTATVNTSGSASGGSSSSLVITTTADGCLIWCGADDDSSGGTFAPPPGMAYIGFSNGSDSGAVFSGIQAKQGAIDCTPLIITPTTYALAAVALQHA
jgi:hypothetical protein